MPNFLDKKDVCFAELHQFICEYEPDRYTYVEYGSKHHQRGFGTKRQSNKVVTIYGNPDAEPSCVVYFSKFPKLPKSMDFFYLKPLPKAPADIEAPWFEPNPIGKNTLGKFVDEMYKEAGITAKNLTIA